ncbi:efflux RND transporter periplasmic adaptor subunit [Nostoc sp. DedSLP04]|uniref:efflux RND transporter periplasmic adaptor subunit n=1 Tax=Nostoc sp. DedSLP04 TaxID=3075401 RepID=UPI002AD25C83|nr:efflux RND transporter periplasmic adaptor subunit [Nostoc sp. DedSLP04]MDZ8030335.1 efflux RND transporter periplasmic adaptor subunit [Nostoc sp. DedSLP04]
MNWKYEKAKFNIPSRWLAWSGVLALAGAGGWLTYFLALNQPPEPLAVRLLTVERGNVETTINESGTVELREQRILKSPKEGAVEQVMVKPGERVKLGQVLLTLRYPERKVALTNQQLQIQQEQLNLARSREKIIEAQERLTAEEKQLQRLAPLVREGAIAQEQAKTQEDTVRVARASLRDSQAEARTTALKIQTLQLERQLIQQQLQDNIVTAPLNGVVLGVNVENGDGVELRTNLLTLGDPRKVLVKLQLSTLNAAQVRINQLARINAIGPNARRFSGRVKSLYPQALSPEAQKQDGSSSKQSEQPTVPATVELDSPTRTLLPGSRVNVEVVLQQRQNVVVLKTEAIVRSQPRPFVWVLDSQNQAQKRTINLGLEGLMNVEVTSGLHPGEQVILPPVESELKPGTPVKAGEQGSRGAEEKLQ